MTIAASFLLTLGSALLLLAALGILRMPDLYMRMSSSSKAVTLGAGFLALGLALHVDDLAVSTRALLIVVIFLLKAPVAAHMLGHSAYFSGVPLWEKTIVDELRAADGEVRDARPPVESGLAQAPQDEAVPLAANEHPGDAPSLAQRFRTGR